jgi:thiol:disulfide interchange protein
MKTNKLFSVYQLVFFTFLFCVLMNTSAIAQKDSVLIYHPEANAKEELNNALAQAKTNNKHVLIMVGGNWCRWCRMFEKFIAKDRDENGKIDSIINNGFVFLHINYSKENKNLDIMQSLSYPQRFGFPVFLVLDANGIRLHTQNSAYLEEGEGYSEQKIIDFLNHWNPAAMDPALYNK